MYIFTFSARAEVDYQIAKTCFPKTISPSAPRTFSAGTGSVTFAFLDCLQRVSWTTIAIWDTAPLPSVETRTSPRFFFLLNFLNYGRQSMNRNLLFVEYWERSNSIEICLMFANFVDRCIWKFDSYWKWQTNIPFYLAFD